MRRSITALLLTLMILLVAAPTALAIETRDSMSIYVGPHEIINDDMALTGTTITIDGVINGDVVAAGGTLLINGTINGNLLAAVESVEVRGTVNGSLVALGRQVVIKGRVERSLVSAGTSVIIDRSGSVGHSWISAGDRLELLGSVGRGMALAGERISINGSAGKELRAAVKHLEIGASARIPGEVRYHSDRAAQIDAGASLGPVTFTDEYFRWTQTQRAWFTSPWWIALKFGGFVVVGLLLLALFPRLRTRFPKLLEQKVWQAPLAGFLMLIAVPVGSVLLLLTLIGAPLALITLLALPVAIYAGQILISWTVGRFLGDTIPAMRELSWQALFVIGALATTLMIEIPVLGNLAAFGALIFGLGGLYYVILQRDETTA